MASIVTKKGGDEWHVKAQGVVRRVVGLRAKWCNFRSEFRGRMLSGALPSLRVVPDLHRLDHGCTH